MIKLCAVKNSYPVADLLNQKLIYGKFPDVFNIAKVLPFHKKGSYEDPSIFKPKSLLSSISKVIEKNISSKEDFFLENSS